MSCFQCSSRALSGGFCHQRFGGDSLNQSIKSAAWPEIRLWKNATLISASPDLRHLACSTSFCPCLLADYMDDAVPSRTVFVIRDRHLAQLRLGLLRVFLLLLRGRRVGARGLRNIGEFDTQLLQRHARRLRLRRPVIRQEHMFAPFMGQRLQCVPLGVIPRQYGYSSA